MTRTLAADEKEALRQQLCAMQQYVLEELLVERAKRSIETLTSVSEETAADVIYQIDAIADRAILEWFAKHWDNQSPVQIIMEGLEDALTFPHGTAVEDTTLKCIIDPIDGTRGIMYDKRSAWILAAIAPQHGETNTIQDLQVATMTEIPTTRQWRSDQLSATQGGGVIGWAFDLREGLAPTAAHFRPSQASEVRHAFATVSRFFPEACELLAQFEEALCLEVYGPEDGHAPLIFNDQYISNGGQFYEILSGHDRFVADLRPLALEKLGLGNKLSGHPYDICCALILQEAGAIIEKPDGSPLDYPLDTTTPVSWVAYANQTLAGQIRPALIRTVEQVLA
ncbi:MAG: inositol monophosphatase [Verrucomicrobiota bacterium]